MGILLIKCSSSSFTLPVGIGDLNKSEGFFQISAMYILYLAKMKERGRQGSGIKGEMNNPTPCFAVFRPPYNYVLCGTWERSPLVTKDKT